MIVLRNQPPVYRGKKYMKNKICFAFLSSSPCYCYTFSTNQWGFLVSWESTASCQSHDVGSPSVSVAFIG